MTMNAELIAALEQDSWTKPYIDAGHDLASLLTGPAYKCSRCGANQIDLSEDLAYGPMTRCAESGAHERNGDD
jgi:hypothetical protein